MPTTYNIPLQKRKPIHMRIIELHLLCWKNKDIQAELGVSSTTISHTLNDPIAQKIISTILNNLLEHRTQYEFAKIYHSKILDMLE